MAPRRKPQPHPRFASKQECAKALAPILAPIVKRYLESDEYKQSQAGEVAS